MNKISSQKYPLINNTDNAWKDLNYDEKIERTHQVVRNLIQQVNFLQQQVQKLTTEISCHSHDKNDNPVMIQKISHDNNQDPPAAFVGGPISRGLFYPTPLKQTTEDEFF